MKSKHRLRAALAAATLVAVPTVIADSSPVEAAGCSWAWRDTNGNNLGREFRVSNTSPCSDLNAKRPTVSQTYLGEYFSNGSWRGGAAGWVWMAKDSNTNRVLISNIANGTRVRVTGCCANAQLLVGT